MARTKFFNRRRRKREKITIQRLGEARNAMNERDPNNWGDVFETRAAVLPAPGTEKWLAAQENATFPMIFEVRSEGRTDAILPSDRVYRHKDGRNYNIIALEQPESDSDIRIGAVADTGA